MPTRQHKGTRRSSRVRGISHNLLELTDSTTNQKAASKESTKKNSSTLIKQTAPRCSKSNEEEEAYVQEDESSEEEELVSEHVVEYTKPHPLKNYTKPNLYDRWKKAGKEAAKHKVLCGELQK